MTEPGGPGAGATSTIPKATISTSATANEIGFALRRCFVAALVAGAALVAWGERAGLAASPLAAGGPLAVMTIYLVVGLRCQRAEAARTRLAESTFHLGVLLAGLSLLASLASLAPPVDAAALAPRLAGALPMLLLGHAARVCLTRFRPSCEETATEVQAMLAASARALRARLEEVDRDLQAQAGAMNVVLRSTLQGVQGELARILTTGGTAFDHALRDMRASVTGSLDRVRRRIEASELPVDVFTRQLHEPLEELARVIAMQAKRMDEASASLAAAQAILDEQLRLAERMR